MVTRWNAARQQSIFFFCCAQPLPASTQGGFRRLRVAFKRPPPRGPTASPVITGEAERALSPSSSTSARREGTMPLADAKQMYVFHDLRCSSIFGGPGLSFTSPPSRADALCDDG
ncbi:hypothetical protein TcCL_NonESM13325 [Trypanosoma cruzi]|nr:hypothetical protein TcCL_NonESM13325 [Trypanosoma cruzi]